MWGIYGNWDKSEIHWSLFPLGSKPQLKYIKSAAYKGWKLEELSGFSQFTSSTHIHFHAVGETLTQNGCVQAPAFCHILSSILWLFNILLMGIFYHMGFFKAFSYFCEGSAYCKTYCGENNCILFSYPAYHVETIKTCGKIVTRYSIDPSNCEKPYLAGFKHRSAILVIIILLTLQIHDWCIYFWVEKEKIRLCAAQD